MISVLHLYNYFPVFELFKIITTPRIVRPVRMFSLSGVPPQVILPLGNLGHLGSVLSSLRSTICNRPPWKIGNSSPAVTTTAVDDHTSTSTDSDLEESISVNLADLGLGDLFLGEVNAEDLTFFIKPHILQFPSSSLPHWKSRSASAHTFFENKYGFSEDQLWESTFGDKPVTLTMTLPNIRTPCRRLHTRWLPQSMVQQTRGLQTRSRQTGLGIGMKPKNTGMEESYSNKRLGDSYKRLRESVLDYISGSSKAKFTEKGKTRTSEFEHLSNLQDKLDLAFGKGYRAAHDEKAKGSDQNVWPSRLGRIIRHVSLILLTCAIVYYGMVVLAYRAIGGNMKMNPLKGESYNEVNPEDIKISFDDVKGVDEAKQELKDVVEFLKDPDRFKTLGAKLPKGVLLVGPPGIGKTLLARAVAGEASVPFFHMSGSEFDDTFVGVGAKKVRHLFDAAKVRAPCVIFIDEIDTVGAKRTSSQIHPYANQTINQLLSEMDGFEQNEGVIVLGATNRRDNLDRALLRPGRFDVEVRVFPPDLKGRKDILELYLKRVVVHPDIDIDKVARGTTGCTGADLENLVNQAALKAAMDGATSVSMVHMEFSRDKVLMGPAKKTRITDEETNEITAYHEAGHTLVAYYTKNAIPLNKVTIIPRGTSLGHTSFMPEKDEYNQNKSQLMAQLDVAMGGRVAEELIFGPDKVTTGASADFQVATSIATAMVKQYGMSDKVGVRVFHDEPFDAGLSQLSVNEVSPATTEVLDNEIRRFLQESYERARGILKTHSAEHKAIAKALLKYETLDVEEIKSIVEGKKVKKGT